MLQQFQSPIHSIETNDRPSESTAKSLFFSDWSSCTTDKRHCSTCPVALQIHCRFRTACATAWIPDLHARWPPLLLQSGRWRTSRRSNLAQTQVILRPATAGFASCWVVTETMMFCLSDPPGLTTTPACTKTIALQSRRKSDVKMCHQRVNYRLHHRERIIGPLTARTCHWLIIPADSASPHRL